jgi:hypothetical protein
VRAQEFCAFLLTLTYIDVGQPEITFSNDHPDHAC